MASLLLIGTALLAGGCGFQLRSWDFSDADLSVRVQADPLSRMAAPLRDALRQAGALASASADDADLVVQIVNESRNRRVASLTAGARAAEFELTLGVQFGIRAGERSLINPAWIRASRTFRIDRDNLAGSSEEEALIEQELKSALSQQILRSLNAVAATLSGVESDADQA
ncbi:MAG: hypothetical protein OXP11_13495 [Gammaproteobacteria bacterium]|nr:hypothetical protein [Gammaproteobacteria bacterium]